MALCRPAGYPVRRRARRRPLSVPPWAGVALWVHRCSTETTGRPTGGDQLLGGLAERERLGRAEHEPGFGGVLTQGWTPLGEGKTFDFPQIADICTRTGKSPTQVTLRWHMQLGHSTVPRATDPAHQRENLDIFDFALTDDEGNFEIKGLPPGNYEISFLHERPDMTCAPATISVEAGKAASLTAQFTR